MDNFVSSSRRQKLLDVVNNTKTTYLPSLVKTIGSLTYPSSNPDAPLPEDTQICIYNAYSVSRDGVYDTEITGWVYAPGAMNRKNRMLLSLMNKFTKSDISPSTEAMLQTQIVEEADAPSLRRTGTSSSQSTASTASSTASLGSEVLKTRLASTFARSLGNIHMKLVLGSEDPVSEDLVQDLVVSDARGMFSRRVQTRYKPSVVQLSCVDLDTTTVFKDVMCVQPTGVSVVSDIDDTVRLTGVLGSKSELLRNVFVKDYVDCAVPGVAQWYNALLQRGCQFHYVSNGPWQVYNVICEYMAAVGLPHGTIHLRQFNGNFISSLFQPPLERKKSTLEKLVNEFPLRKFVLVGDSGEYDLDTYHGLAMAYPERVEAIYIRVVAGSFSDYDDYRVLEDIHEMIHERDARTVPEKDLIDLDAKVKPAPPTKPDHLKGRSIRPQLPERVPSPTTAPALPRRRTFQQPDVTEEELSDKRGEEWRERVRYIVDTLPAHIDFKLWYDVSDVLEESLRLVQSYEGQDGGNARQT